jgi:hypothetical protein
LIRFFICILDGNPYYRCVEYYFETFVKAYNKYFSRQHGAPRPCVEQVICRYLDCGDLHNGFACVVVAVQTFGDFLDFNPHRRIIVTDGCFYGIKAMFRVAPPLEMKKLEAPFRQKVFKMPPAKGNIPEDLIRLSDVDIRESTSSAVSASRPAPLPTWCPPWWRCRS